MDVFQTWKSTFQFFLMCLITCLGFFWGGGGVVLVLFFNRQPLVMKSKLECESDKSASAVSV